MESPGTSLEHAQSGEGTDAKGNSTPGPELDIYRAIVLSCQDKYGQDRCRILENQGDYSFILKLLLLGQGIWAQLCISRDNTDLMDVFLRSEGDVSIGLKQEFNRVVSNLRSRSEVGECLEESLKWWDSVGREQHLEDIQLLRKAGKLKLKNKAKAKKHKSEEEKRKSAAKKKNSEAEDTEGAHQLGGMKPSQDVVNRILWDPVLDKGKFTVGYLDRFLGIIEKPFTAFSWDNFDTVDPDDSAIPRHRIYHFKYNDKMVWDRKDRVDLIFCSTGTPKEGQMTLDQLLLQERKTSGAESEVIQSEETVEDGSDEDEEASWGYAHANQSNEEKEAAVLGSVSQDNYNDVPPGVRPDFYLALPIRSPEVVRKLLTLQDNLRNNVVKKFSPGNAFHITLCLFCNSDLGSEGIGRLVNVLSSKASELESILASTQIRFRGLKLLRQYRVVVTEPDCADLVPLWTKLKEILAEFNIQFYAPTKLHLTICRLRSVYDPAVLHPMENLCAVSRFTAVETFASLALKESGSAFDAGYFLTIPSDVKPPTAPTIADLQPSPNSSDPLNVGVTKKLVGYHVRDAYTYDSMAEVAYKIASVGAKALAFFFVDQRTLNLPPPLTEKQVEDWKSACQKCDIDMNSIVPHGSYSLNPGSVNREEVGRTIQHMIVCVERCQILGIRHFNFHIGQLKKGYEESEISGFLSRVALSINVIHNETKKSNVILVMETGAGQGSEIGWKFEHLRSVIDLVKDKSRIGVCMDTCHVFAAGYDIRTRFHYEETMAEFDRVIGIDQYLKAIHLNDSKGKLGDRVDRHETIGRGQIGIDAFELIMQDSRLDTIPLILETPWSHDHHFDEIQLLSRLEATNNSIPAPHSAMSVKVEEKQAPLVGSDLSNEIWEFYHKKTEKPEDFARKEQCRLGLEEIIKNEVFPKHTIQLTAVGGTVSGLATKNSDLDLCLIIQHPNRGTDTDWHFSLTSLKQVYHFLTGFMSEITNTSVNQDTLFPLRHLELRPGVIPILRLETKQGLQIDINCNDAPSVYDSHLLHYYSRVDSRFPAVCLVIKEWAKFHKINDASIGFINNYTFVLMVLHYFQAGRQAGLLPNLQSLFPDRFSKQNPLHSLRYNEELPKPERQKRTGTDPKSEVGEILIGFFEYFATMFDYSTSWISIKTGAALSRSDLPESESVQKCLLYVEDPFEERNTARCLLDNKKLAVIKNKCTEAVEDLKSDCGLRSLWSK